MPRRPGKCHFYQSEDGRARLQGRMEGKAVRLSKRDMAELSQTTKLNVSLNTFEISSRRES